MAGYSTTPLWKKLGFKSESSAFVDGQPETYLRQLNLPKDVKIEWLNRARDGIGFVHIFSTKAAELNRKLVTLRRQVAQDGVVWVSWPKKSSGVGTDITEDTIRELALPLGFVDVKVCAVDEIWSGLKLMIRRTERERKGVTH